MPRILDFHVGEANDAGQWRGDNRYPPANPRLITAIVRRLIEHEIRHPIYKRVNVILCPKNTPDQRQAPSTFSKNWIDFYYGVPLDEFSAQTPTEQECETARLVFQSAFSLFDDDEATTDRLRTVRDEFEAYYESKIASFRCRTKETKTYRVDVSFSINWGADPPFFVAFVDYTDLKSESSTKRMSFPLRGTDNDIFELCGRISMRDGEILLQPRDTHREHLKRLRYDVPFTIPIAEMKQPEDSQQA